MFFKPLFALDKSSFINSISIIKDLYYPYGMYDKIVKSRNDAMQELHRIAPKFDGPNFDALDLEGRMKALNEWKSQYVSKVSSQERYLCLHTSDASPHPVPLPLTENFHNYFLHRKYTYPITRDYRDQEIEWKDFIFRLGPYGRGAAFAYNYSANFGDFNHFGNVFAAVTRLIQYFSDGAKVHHILSPFYNIVEWEIFADDIRYQYVDQKKKISYDSDKGRIFRLLVSTFYHDVGKTIVSHRDALEGAILIAFHARNFLQRFGDILQKSTEAFDAAPERLDRDDVILIEDLVHYHNLYGMMATGETGYVALSDVVDSFRRYSQKYAFSGDGRHPPRDAAISRQTLWGMRCIFDLWVLNVADIMTCCRSITNGSKGDDQIEFWSDDSKWKPRIEQFLTDPHGETLCHDLMLSFDLLKKHAQRLHADDTADVARAAKEYANRHGIERIVRLVSATLNYALDERGDNDELSDRIHQERCSHWRIHAIINRLVRSFGDVQEFSQNLAWIGLLDYALPFFAILAKEALREPWKRSEGETDADAKAIAVIEDYISVVVQILRRLLEREPSLQAIRNFEFSTARDRLEPSPEKVSRVLGREGPYRQQRAIHLVLGSIFVW